MQIQYFQDTDTLYLIFNLNLVSETRDLDENSVIDVDENGSLVSITIEHASERTDIASFSYQQIVAPTAANRSKAHQSYPLTSRVPA